MSNIQVKKSFVDNTKLHSEECKDKNNQTCNNGNLCKIPQGDNRCHCIQFDLCKQCLQRKEKRINIKCVFKQKNDCTNWHCKYCHCSENN